MDWDFLRLSRLFGVIRDVVRVIRVVGSLGLLGLLGLLELLFISVVGGY
jgi:hypothetical protein